MREALASATRRLDAAGVEAPARDASLLLAAALGVEPMAVHISPDRAVSGEEIKRFQNFVDRRSEREPVSRILARRSFWGREFWVARETLDPRPETETLIAAALEKGPFRRFLDLGTGTGIIAVTLLAEWEDAVCLATDVSRACVNVARTNAASHRVEARFRALGSDWFEHVTGRYPLIVSNPPYIAAAEMAGLAPEVRDHDPAIALTDGGDGLAAYRAITAGLGRHLEPSGWLMVEIGPTQAGPVTALFAAAGLGNVSVLQDLDGRDRVVTGQRPA